MNKNILGYEVEIKTKMWNFVLISSVGILISFLQLLPCSSSVVTPANLSTGTADSYLKALEASKNLDSSQNKNNGKSKL